MRLPLSWLGEFLSNVPAPEVLAERLTSLGIEVESIETIDCPCQGVVIVEIRHVRPHPEADRLVIADIWNGVETATVVCGAPNCRPGLLTAWAAPGARLPGVEGMISIETARVRGVDSTGMLCSMEELGLGAGAEGIWELGEGTEAGARLEDVWKETVLHLSFTPNLGHAMSVLGIAREISASLDIPLQDPTDQLPTLQRLPQGLQTLIQDPRLCPHYHLLSLQGPFKSRSPLLWQKRLVMAGVRPISPLVDLTNLVLLERGQPLHAFDAARVQAPISVRNGRAGETLELLNGSQVAAEGLPVIADSERALAIAGVMGGAASAVSSATTAALVECAVFDPIRVRVASKRLAIRSESSMRFERGLDAGGCSKALKRVAELCRQLGGEAVALSSAGTTPVTRRIALHLPWLRVRLGLHLGASEVEALLTRLRCEVEIDNESLSVTPPSDRNDLSDPIDLVEEVARLYGYDNLPRREHAVHLGTLSADPVYRALERIRESFVSQGLQEFLTCALISPAQAALVSHPLQVCVQNPASEEHSVLRPSLLPGLLQALQTNQAHREGSVAGFELGRVHLRSENRQYLEPWSAGLILCGAQSLPSWSIRPADWDFFSGKGLLNSWAQSLGLKGSWRLERSSHPLLHPHRQALLFWEEQEVGRLGELHPQVVKDLGLRGRPIVAELALDSWIPTLQAPATRLKAPPEFPSTERDCTLALPRRWSVARIDQAIHGSAPAHLESWSLTTVYDDPQDPSIHHVTWRFVYRDRHRTLTGAEVDSAQAELVEKLVSALASVQE